MGCRKIFYRFLLGFFVFLLIVTPTTPTEEQWYTRSEKKLRTLEKGGKLYGHHHHITFENGDWIHVIYISWHRPSINPAYYIKNITKHLLANTRPIGDGILGLGSDGRLYWNPAHNCGGYSWYLQEEPKSLGDYLAQQPDNQEYWHTYENYSSVAEYKAKENTS